MSNLVDKHFAGEAPSSTITAVVESVPGQGELVKVIPWSHNSGLSPAGITLLKADVEAMVPTDIVADSSAGPRKVVALAIKDGATTPAHDALSAVSSIAARSRVSRPTNPTAELAGQHMLFPTAVLAGDPRVTRFEKLKAQIHSSAALQKIHSSGWVKAVFWVMSFHVETTEGSGHYFDGVGSGVTFPFGYVDLTGDLYADDPERLFRDTTGIEWNGLTAWLNMIFFDSQHNALGHFEAGGLNPFAGVGGANGTWV